MPKPVAVVDSSSIIALDAIDAIPLLAWVFSRVWLPKAVRKDIYRRRRAKNRLTRYLEKSGFLRPCDSYDQLTVDVLLPGKIASGRKDRGETETVVQAETLKAEALQIIAIIDDAWGRDLAKRMAVECHGTLWVLEQFYDLGLRSGRNLAQDIEALRRHGFWLPDQPTEALLARIRGG